MLVFQCHLSYLIQQSEMYHLPAYVCHHSTRTCFFNNHCLHLLLLVLMQNNTFTSAVKVASELLFACQHTCKQAYKHTMIFTKTECWHMNTQCHTHKSTHSYPRSRCLDMQGPGLCGSMTLPFGKSSLVSSTFPPTCM